jgi:hypothetical protein
MAFTAARQIYERHKTPALQSVLCFNKIDTKTSEAKKDEEVKG